MEVFSDPVVLARLQFAATALFHFLFVPLSVGFGLIMAILQTKAAKSGDVHDVALARFWLRIFTVTFAVGVATGITMEFSFGTNWADYSRFVGDIFGAPLAAEALFAFFLESVFLGVLLFGRNRVSQRFYTVSAWLVWGGSCLSALWIIIANSWMQTPAGYEVVETAAGSKAVMTNFFEAAFNPSTIQRYLHVVMALLIMGAFVAIAIAAYYKLKNRDDIFASKLLRVGVITAIATTVLMLPAAHMQAVAVVENQPAKLAAMEGQYETGPVELSLIGWVDESAQKTYAISIPGGTSFLADFDFTTEYPGLNDFPVDEQPEGVNFIFQSYHLMVAMFGLIALVVLLALLVMFDKLQGKKWVLRILQFGWIAPILAIEFGWVVAEFGRQPWIVYGELKTADAISQSVSATQLLITLALFIIVYVIIYVVWAKIVLKTVKAGPSVYLPEEQAKAGEEA
ncbi:MAG: cytochrome ubiquinol oxidase subunit I [Coriobacteriales bacterium]|nr:cytochrome ubiquinol oxidase subunit I [Coriobacteriales bacterium]